MLGAEMEYHWESPTGIWKGYQRPWHESGHGLLLFALPQHPGTRTFGVHSLRLGLSPAYPHLTLPPFAPLPARLSPADNLLAMSVQSCAEGPNDIILQLPVILLTAHPGSDLGVQGHSLQSLDSS